MSIASKLAMRLFFGFAVGFAAACEDDTQEQELESLCANKTTQIAACNGVSYDCEQSPCYEDCISLGKDAADGSDTCGELWIGVYQCIVDMTCEGHEEWGHAVQDDNLSYPCGKLEGEFRETCPDVPLFGPHS